MYTCLVLGEETPHFSATLGNANDKNDIHHAHIECLDERELQLEGFERRKLGSEESPWSSTNFVTQFEPKFLGA